MTKINKNYIERQIKYVGFYDLDKSPNKRASSVAAISKMDYICDALLSSGFSVHLISPSWFINSEAKIAKQTTVKISERKKITFCPSIGTRNKLLGYIKVIFSLFWLCFYLLVHASKGETILVYNSPWLSVPIRISKFFKGFRLLLELEEIYADVSSLHKYFDKCELKLIDSADIYIFSTELLAKRIAEHKAYCINYGPYRVTNVLEEPLNDGKIHLLYAGIIDTNKMGAFNAVESTRYLPDNYVLHVIGFGETELLCRRIAELNSSSSCQIYFDGIKKGDDYISYSQRCHIGLSSQKMAGRYLETSFPSKILSYLCMGLRVVSCHVNCVVNSKVNSVMSYYTTDTPEAIAQAILSVNLNTELDSRSLIRQLDENFIQEIRCLIGEH